MAALSFVGASDLEPCHHFVVATFVRPMQWSSAIVGKVVWVRTVIQQQFDQRQAATPGGPGQA